MEAFPRYCESWPASAVRGDPVALLRLYRQTRDPGARERLVELYLPLVRSLARRYAHRGERLEDLVQVGAIGLIEAIDRFDPSRGRDLASLAVPTITGEIKNHLRDRTCAVRVPRRLAELTVRLRRSREGFAARVSRLPTVSELALEAGVGEGEVAQAEEAELARTLVPLQGDEGAAAPPDDAIVVEDAFETSDDRLLLAAGFRTLGARERRILHLRFFAELSQAEIAGEVGLSQVQVSRVIRSSLERMRGALVEGRPSVADDKSVVGV